MQDCTQSLSYGGSVKAVIFDLAGTVIDFGSCAPAGAFVALFESYGVTATLTQARVPMGLHKRDHIRTMLEMPELTQQWQARHDRPWTEQDVEALYQDFIPLQLKALPNYGDLIPGAAAMVKSLQERGIKVGVSTGYNHEMLEMVLQQAADQGLVPDAATCGTAVPSGRPAPWMIYRLMEELNVYPASSVVKVGDTLADIQAGLNAGVWSVGVTRTGNMLGMPEAEVAGLSAEQLDQRLEKATEAMDQARAHYVIEGVADLDDVIASIEDRLREKTAV